MSGKVKRFVAKRSACRFFCQTFPQDSAKRSAINYMIIFKPSVPLTCI
jgi:hypothetical protein